MSVTGPSEPGRLGPQRNHFLAGDFLTADEFLDRLFSPRPPRGTQPERYAAVRAKGRELAELILASCPGSDERDRAVDAVREAVMWANNSIAVNEP